MKHLVWLLVMVNSNGGIISIPQLSRERCVQQAVWVQDNQEYVSYTVVLKAFCMEGA